MLIKQRWILGGMVVAVMLALSVGPAVAQEEPPPVQPADVGSQAVEAWNQLETPIAGSTFLLTVPSYEEHATINGLYGASIAADDFLLTNMGDPNVSAWFLSQVVVRAQVLGDWASMASKASICFYRDEGGKPSAGAYSCPGYNPTNIVVDTDGDYKTLTYSLTSSPPFFVNTRYWLSVKMTDLPSGSYWYWRVRSAVYPGTYAFAGKITGRFKGDTWSGSPCYNTWRVQTGAADECYQGNPLWPYTHDLLFKLMGTTSTATWTSVYLPLVQR